MKRTLLLALLLFAAFSIYAQTALSGKVVDIDNDKDPLPFATVQVYKNGAFYQGTTTDLDGNYYFSNIDPGTYDLQVDYTGYPPTKLTAIPVKAGQTNFANVEMSSNGGIALDVVVVTDFKVPLIEQDNTTSGQTVTSEQIRNLPTRNINQIASITAGASSADEGGAINIRGSRSNATDYYVDGVRVSAVSIPDSEIEQLQVVTGGLEARYGDVTGGIISITTKGFSDQFRVNAEAETSEGLDAYGNSLVGVSFTGPLLRNKKKDAVLGYRLSARYTYQEDDDPSAVPIFRAKDDVIAALEENPVIRRGGRNLVAADFLTSADANSLKTRPFEEASTLNLNGNITARLSDAIDVTVTGAYGDNSNQFTPGENGAGNWRLLNAQNNPTAFSQNYRGNVRLRHRLGGNGVADGGSGKSSVLQNASYNLQFTVENRTSSVADPRHGENFFDYGHVGTFDIDYIPIYGIRPDTANPLEIVTFHSDYREVLRSYDPSTSSNPVLTNYNNFFGYGADEIFNSDVSALSGGGTQGPTLDGGFATINGRTQTLFTDQWGFNSNVGTVYNLYQKTDNDLYTFQANASFEIVPGSSDKSRHSIQLGVWYEQRTDRAYSLNPRALWTVGRQLVNRHIPSVAETNRVVDSVALLLGEDVRTVAVLAPTVDNIDGQFYRSIRERLGVPLDQHVNIDGLDPSQLSLDLFSARELTFNNLLNYYGYDYLGNEFNGSFDDFFTLDPNTGERAFNVAPNRPIYAAAYIQDKFTINKMIFRLGLRVERFDANTKVLKDPYSLYEIIGADDFHSNFGGTQPGNIGADYAVYTSEENGTEVQAYRSGDAWFLPDGSPTNGPQEIDGIRSGLVFPKYANPLVNNLGANFIKSDEFTVDDSFKDYEVQFNVLPRLAFSFPISDDANFFAHYDVLVQRPPSGSIATPLDYFFFVENAGSRTFSNSALRPERTVDYKVGFKTRLSNTSALTLEAYYREMRDMIQLRTYFPVPLVQQYTTFDNQDFGTVKGFALTYDLRRTANFTINANYTLQFADGTGSNATSQRGLGNRGNLRTLFPLDFDERHRFNLVLDYRLDSRSSAPKFLHNAGINLQSSAVTGRPYTATFLPEEFGGSGTRGAINGSRQPLTLTLNGQVSKDITFGQNSQVNIYFRVSNILDRRNVLNVYSATGSPTDPGFLQSIFGLDQIRSLEGGTRPVESYLATYQQRVLNPDFFTLPRRMFVGAIFSL
ncbi:TonB-dependent receptor [Neolewinella lacunae]|uniref:Carboxypeptidase regulatory-like domain-containing protein n=1 Tax=Neolewinella lacunae TaxID=1517758 RepID=A0A923PJL7_9BACT|nr:TonB-dependent receptor [Neolewinella lacunae]MBC6995265.1 carboxypeptidase regulatory-like domain-containing protein [Neolewinella lacunae]MDN3635566.1 TonB-dependent receptor [Neolewinella lacunae]